MVQLHFCKPAPGRTGPTAALLPLRRARAPRQKDQMNRALLSMRRLMLTQNLQEPTVHQEVSVVCPICSKAARAFSYWLITFYLLIV